MTVAPHHVPNGIVTPRPDPTDLTTDQMRREVAGLRELIEARLEGMDKTHALMERSVEAVKFDRAAAITEMEKLFGEKLNTVNIQFQGIRQLAEALQKAADTAIQAAFLAADKAVASQYNNFSQTITRMEASNTKENDAQKLLLGATKDTFQTQLIDLRGRIDRGEGVTRGSTETRTEHRLDNGALVAYFVAAVMAIGLLLTWNSSHQQQPQIVAPAVVPVQPPPAAPR